MAKYKPVIKRVEIDDSHYYLVQEGDEWVHYPSVTKILSETMPMSYGLRKWIGDKGNEKAEQILHEAAERGSAIHHACEQLLLEGSLGEEETGKTFQSLFPSKEDQKCVIGFTQWVNDYKPVIKDPSHVEMVVASTQRFAGTLDIFCEIDGVPHIIDIKTSNSIHDQYRLQLAAYRYAFWQMTGIRAKMAILHLKAAFKKGYSFYHEDNSRGNLDIKGVKVRAADFMRVYKVYEMLNRGIPEPPKTVQYPEKIVLFND